jgi:hypothetical protein
MRTLPQESEGQRPSESRGTGHSWRFPPNEQPRHDTLNLTNVRHSPRLISGTNVTDEPMEATPSKLEPVLGETAEAWAPSNPPGPFAPAFPFRFRASPPITGLFSPKISNLRSALQRILCAFEFGWGLRRSTREIQ